MRDSRAERCALWAACGIGLSLLVVAAAQLRIPYLSELASHTIDAARIWQRQIDCSAVYRLPLGYPGLLSPFVAAFGEPWGVKLANLAVFGLLQAAACGFVAAATRAGGPTPLGWRFGTRAAALAVLLLLTTFYPYMALNVARANEAVAAAALLVVFLWLLFERPTLAAVIAAAACLGIAMHVRANMVSLLLPALLWLVCRSRANWFARGALAATGLAVLAVTYSLMSLLLAGCAWYNPTNGGYNLFAGNNPLSASYLRDGQNAEYSIIPALRAEGMDVSRVADGYAVPQEVYIRLAERYVADCPLCAAKLAALKTAVFFSPRLHNAGSAAEIAVQSLLAALTLAAFAVALWRFLRRRGYEAGLLLAIFAAYAAPFALTNADPRLRFPLDVVALCYWALWLGRGAARRWAGRAGGAPA